MTHSYTIPSDILDFCIVQGLCPNDITTSNTTIAFRPYDASIPSECTICGSRDCAKEKNSNPNLGVGRTIFTCQGQRFKTATFHICWRDLVAVEAGNTFQKRRLLFTALTRVTDVLMLDFSPRAAEQLVPSFRSVLPIENDMYRIDTLTPPIAAESQGEQRHRPDGGYYRRENAAWGRHGRR